MLVFLKKVLSIFFFLRKYKKNLGFNLSQAEDLLYVTKDTDTMIRSFTPQVQKRTLKLLNLQPLEVNVL